MSIYESGIVHEPPTNFNLDLEPSTSITIYNDLNPEPTQTKPTTSTKNIVNSHKAHELST